MEHVESVGHVEFLGDWEYFAFNGELYRALRSNPLDVNGIRKGGRWQSPPHLMDSTLDYHREMIAA